MFTELLDGEPRTVRRVFAAWSIEVPETFAETFVRDEAYWHAFDEDRSVSLTSIVVTDGGRPVTPAELVDSMSVLEGLPIDDVPPSLTGRAVIAAPGSDGSAKSVLQGMLAAGGRLLLVTITANDLDWARRVWLSIRGHPAALGQVH